ncbi:adenylate/guanylate cyclase domain-containing protein [Spirochaetota bacterium]
MVGFNNIFLISHDKKLNKKISGAINTNKFTLEVCTESKTCINTLMVQKPHVFLFIIDLASIKQGGHEAVRQIAEHQDYERTPFLFISENKKKQDLFMEIPALGKAAYDFILKPVDEAELKTRIVKLISEHNKHHQLEKMEFEIKKKKLDLETIMHDANEIGKINPKYLTNSLLLSLLGSTMASNASLFVRTNEYQTDYILSGQKGLHTEQVEQTIISEGEHIIQKLHKTHTPIEVNEDFTAILRRNERELIEKFSPALIVPIEYKQKLLAVLFLGEKLNNVKYNQEDIKKLLVLCNQAAINIQNTMLNEVQNTFSYYVSQEMMEYLMENPELIKLGGIKRKAAVLFADIRNFTGISEQISPEEVVNLLNTHFSVLSKVIYNHGGMLDKYIGDCIMAEFGIPISHFDDVERAARAAVEMQRVISHISSIEEKKRGVTIQLGIGIHYGELISGNLGSLDRMDYTVVGDTVNIAARLEEYAKSGQILISQEFLEPIKGFVKHSFVEDASLKGKREKVKIYELHGFLDDDIYTYLREKEPFRIKHFSDVSYLNIKVGQKLGYSEEKLQIFKLATMLLDLGRIIIADTKLASKEKFEAEEIKDIIKKLPLINKTFLDKKEGFSDDVREFISHFNENYDGSGMPGGIEGKEIHEWARIARISDAYIAMTSMRPYRRPLSKQEAVIEIKKKCNVLYDPDIFKIFVQIHK